MKAHDWPLERHEYCVTYRILQNKQVGPEQRRFFPKARDAHLLVVALDAAGERQGIVIRISRREVGSWESCGRLLLEKYASDELSAHLDSTRRVPGTTHPEEGR
jgi:hypothetical protein